MTSKECFTCHMKTIARAVELRPARFDFKSTVAPKGSWCMCGAPAAFEVTGELPGPRCAGCASPLWPENFDKIADGCPCNTPRGINHGIVPKNTCTCDECDPASTGSVRKV